MTAITENFTRSFEETARWNLRFWQGQTPEAIFDAAWQMILDYHLLHDPNVDEPRLQRTVERFGKA
jgi:hypothetical protein